MILKTKKVRPSIIKKSVIKAFWIEVIFDPKIETFLINSGSLKLYLE